MRISRKRFTGSAAAVAAATALIRFPGEAAEFTYKYGNDNRLTHPMGKAAVWWADKVKTDTNGRVEIAIYPQETLGTDPAMLGQLRLGGIQFLAYSGGVLAELAPAAGIDAVAFAFPSYTQLWAALDGDLGAWVRGEVEKQGVHIFARQIDGGFRQMTNNIRPIVTPADLKGMKMRVPPAKIMVSMMTGLGVSAATISIAELYTALQTHVVDAQENNLVNIEDNKLYEVQKFISMTNHSWAGWWLLANKDAWDKLPKNLQDIVSHDYDLSVERQRADVKQLNASLIPKLTSQGMVFNSPELAPFRAAVRASGYYTQWKENYGAQGWAALEKYTGKLA